MAAWLAARSDVPHYGKLIVYLFPKQKLVYGPRQVDARIDQDSAISQQLTLWSQRGSQAIRGGSLRIRSGMGSLLVSPLIPRGREGRRRNFDAASSAKATNRRLTTNP